MSTNVTVPPSGGGSPLSLSRNRLLRGTIARWTDTTGWTDNDGLPLPETMFVIGYTTALQRWKDNKPETITEHPLPDPATLNAAIPVAEWEIGLDGKPRLPWKLVYVIYLIDLNTGAIFTYSNSTYGAKLACEHLEEQISVMRMLRGEHVLPIVRLERRPMKTQFGMKSRPHLQITDWRKPGGGGPKLAPQSSTSQLTGPATVAAPEAAAPAPAATAPAATAAAAPAAAAPAPAASSAPAPAPAAAAASASASAPTPPASTVLDNTQPVKPVTVAELIADELPPWA